MTKRPNNIVLHLGNRKLASAYANHEPTTRHLEWSWYMKIKGETKAIHLGRLKEEDVLDAMDTKYQELRPGEIKKDTSNIKSLADVLRAWFYSFEKQHGPTAPKDYRRSAHTFRNYVQVGKRLLPLCKTINKSTLAQSDITRITETLKSQIAPSTLRLHLRVLQQATNWFREQGGELPAVTIKIPKVPTKEKYTPPQSDAEIVIEAMRTNRTQLAVLLVYKTGARIGEVCNLYWNSFVLIDNERFVRLIGKTGVRYFPIDESLYQKVISYKKIEENESDRIFSKSFSNNVSTSLQKTCVRIGVKKFTCHALRRLKTDELMSKQIEPKIYEDLMGHSYKVGLKIYRQTSKRELHNAIYPKQKPSSIIQKSTDSSFSKQLFDRYGITETELLHLKNSMDLKLVS